MSEVELRPQGGIEQRPAGEVESTRRQRAYQAYAQSPRVPITLKTRRMAVDAPERRRQLARRSARGAAVSFPGAVGRGACRAVVTWWSWVWAHEERQSAREEGRLHHHQGAFRETSKYRWYGTLATLVFVGVVVLLARWFGPGWLLPAAGCVLVLVLAATGRSRTPETAGAQPRGARWLVDASHFADGLRDAKLIGKDETIRMVRFPASDGGGWSTVLDLPGALKASAVIAKREDLAAAFNVDEECLILERDRSAKGHASRLLVWSADSNPFQRAGMRFPLLDVDTWSAWTAAPFGIDARGRVVDLGLMWSNLLIGAQPGKGKTAASRVAAAPFVLDPTVSVRCFDGKGGRDWVATRPLCDQYVCGSDDGDVEALLTALTELKAEARRRLRTMSELPEDECPDNKITEEITRNRSYRMPVTLVIIDELQNYTTAGRSTAGRGEVPIGEKIAELLIWLAKNGRALGIILMLITQRPSGDSLPTELRSQIGSRFGLKVDDWRSSNMILGDQKNTQGYDCSKLLGIPGVGILVPDGELGGNELGWPTLRTFYVNASEWRLLCERGAALRRAAGRLSASHTGPDVVDGDVVPSWLDEVVEAFSGRERIGAAELGDRLGLSPNKLADRMKNHGLSSRRDNRGKYYVLDDVREAERVGT